MKNQHENCTYILCTCHKIDFKSSYLSVRVYSPLTLLEASRTRNVPSGVFLIISFTSSLDSNETHYGFKQVM